MRALYGTHIKIAAKILLFLDMTKYFVIFFTFFYFFLRISNIFCNFAR